MTIQPPRRCGAAQVQAERNPIRLLLRVPVPWVFVLVYLIGALVEHVWPMHLMEHMPYLGVAGGVVLAIGAVIAGWGLVTFSEGQDDDGSWRDFIASGHVGALSFHA